MGNLGQTRLSRRGALALLGAAGLGACRPADGPGAAGPAAGSDAASGVDRAARALPPRDPGCGPPPLPPRRAAVVAFGADGRQRWSVALPVGKDMDANVGPLVEGETVYTTQGDELRALAAADGRQRWRLPLGGHVYDASIAGGVLVVRVGPLDRGRLLGVDPASGRVRWGHPRRPGPLSWQHVGTADGGVVAIGDRGALVVLDRGDGAVRWSRPASRRETPKLFVAAGDRVVRLDRGALEAFAAADGRPLWRTPGVHRSLDHDAWLTATDRDVLVWKTSSDGTAVAAYRLDTGGRRWRLGGLVEPAVVGVGPAGVAVVSVIERGQRHQLLLVDPASGRVRWRRALPGPLLLDMNPALDRLALVTAAEVVLVTNGLRLEPPVTLAAYAARDGAVRWRVPVQAGGWPTWTSDGRLLVVGTPPATRAPEASLTAVDVRGGRVLWRSRLPMMADRPAAALGPGAVIQVWDPAHVCADVGTGDVGTADVGPGDRRAGSTGGP